MQLFFKLMKKIILHYCPFNLCIVGRYASEKINITRRKSSKSNQIKNDIKNSEENKISQSEFQEWLQQKYKTFKFKTGKSSNHNKPLVYRAYAEEMILHYCPK